MLFLSNQKVRVAAGWRDRRVQQTWAVRAGAEEREGGVGPPCCGAAAGRPEQLGEPRAVQLFEAALGERGVIGGGHHIKTFEHIDRYRAVDCGCWGIVSSKVSIHSIGMELSMYHIRRVWPSYDGISCRTRSALLWNTPRHPSGFPCRHRTKASMYISNIQMVSIRFFFCYRYRINSFFSSRAWRRESYLRKQTRLTRVVYHPAMSHDHPEASYHHPSYHLPRYQLRELSITTRMITTRVFTTPKLLTR